LRYAIALLGSDQIQVSEVSGKSNQVIGIDAGSLKLVLANPESPAATLLQLKCVRPDGNGWDWSALGATGVSPSP